MDAAVVGRARRLAIGTVILAALALAPQASAQPRSAAVDAWRQAATSPSALSHALVAHRGKLGPDFRARLRYAHADGTLRVMVTTRARTAATERLARASTTWVQWYGRLPAFYAAVTPRQLVALLRSHAVRLVEADHLLPVDLGA
jgi:hypothetical protein